ncbi:hypothetical protein CDL15_Pgr012985 [Punica granatum]|uniref:Prolyl endopeptidase n=1 Tax=Punica granatum TaxID=22663 RepID=A0A218XF16_PUNGR|nr:hypothetical protein CDL15_Pgr012985 [Punica granatum]
MRISWSVLVYQRRPHQISAAVNLLRYAHYKPPRQQPAPKAPKPPKPPQKPQSFTLHDATWEDPYSWMSNLNDKVAMRHMDVYMEQEEKYTEAVMSDTEKLQSKLMSEMASRLSYDLSTPPVRWGPWVYYRRVEEGKQYPVLCRRLVSLNEEFISHKSPSAGFDFTSGKRIEQKLIDYNQEAERFGGYAYEELSEVSPNHQFFAYTMYDKDNDYFKLSVRNLNSGSLCSKPQAERVSNIAWAMEGKALLYVVTDQHKRPFRIYCSMIGSVEDDVLLLEEPNDNVYVNLRHTKDFQFVTVNTFSTTSSKNVFVLEEDSVVEDVDFSDKYLALIIREGRNFRICSVALPLPVGKGELNLKELNPQFLPLPQSGTQISPGPNYDFCSTTMRFTISSPVMPDAVVDYDLSNGKWNIIQQQNLLHERTRILYGTASSGRINQKLSSLIDVKSDNNPWNELSEFYGWEHYDVPSHDGVMVPLTIVYSHSHRKENSNPGLLHGHGAYGELLDKRWRSELKSLLDRGWVIAYADVRGGGGRGKKWHHDGRSAKKQNAIEDYIASARFLMDKGIVKEDKLAGWGYSAGGLLVASAINQRPNLFRAAILKVPFLDPTNTLLYPILPLIAADYEEFGYPGDVDDFNAIRRYSPYDNIPKDTVFPAVLVTSSFSTRFGVWEAAKWAARVRERTIYDPECPVLLNLTTDIVEENRYLHCKESALETAFLLKVVGS